MKAIYPFNSSCPGCGSERRKDLAPFSSQTMRSKFCGGGFFCRRGTPHLHAECYDCGMKFLTQTKTPILPAAPTGGELSRVP
jgi:hypothetical protein